MDQGFHDRTLAQLHEAIARDISAALATAQELTASAPFCDPTLARLELNLVGAAIALERAQQLLHHSVQVLSGLRLPGEPHGGDA
jgi:hypothetical protein